MTHRAKIVISKAKKGPKPFSFSVVSRNGQTLLKSEKYAQLRSVVNAADIITDNGAHTLINPDYVYPDGVK